MTGYSGFQSNAFQNNAFQIARYGSTPPPVPTTDTHDGWIPDHIVRKFYENERLKHSKVISTYKKLVKAEEVVEELKEAIGEYTADTSKLTKNTLNEIAEDKAALSRFLNTIDVLEKRIQKYSQDAEDDDMLLAISAMI